MKNGYRIWDSDTHIQPSIETVEPYYDPSLRKRLPDLEAYKVPTHPRNGPGRHNYTVGKVSYQRILGQAGPPEVPVANAGKFQGTRLPSQGSADDLAGARIKDMDDEGVEVHTMVPGSFASASAAAAAVAAMTAPA